MDGSEILSVHAASDHDYARKLFATISLGNSTVKFQLDRGATCNLLPAKYLVDRNELQLTRKWLKCITQIKIKQHTAKDASLQELIQVLKAGWPETKAELSHLVLPYFGIRDELSIDDDVVVRWKRLVVLKSLRRDLMRRPHYVHSGVVSSLPRARECIYQPGPVMSSEIQQFIETCGVCRSYDKRQPKEMLISHEVLDRP